MKPRVNLMNQRFTRLLVTAKAPDKNGRSQWLCLCDCGAEAHVGTVELRNEKTTSCGCRARELTKKRFSTHARSRTREYRSWQGMLARCTNSHTSDYHNYGGRGIKVCIRWRSFENFLADMGEKPTPRHTIERLDNDGDYKSSNCIWATPSQQANNKRTNRIFEYRGARMLIADAARLAGDIVARETARHRIKIGWSVEKAVETPPLFRRDENGRRIPA